MGDMAPTQSCDIELWYVDSLGDVLGAVFSDNGGQRDCRGTPQASGDCLETINQLTEEGGDFAELVRDFVESVAGGTAEEACSDMCTRGCYGAYGMAFWYESPCFVDGAPYITVRLRCMPPWGLVTVIATIVLCKCLCKVCCDDEESNNNNTSNSNSSTGSAAVVPPADMSALVGVSFMVVAPVTLRSGASVNTPKVGDLAVGTQVTALQAILKDGHQRIQVSASPPNWASTV